MGQREFRRCSLFTPALLVAVSPFFLPSIPSPALLLSQRAMDLLEGITEEAWCYCALHPDGHNAGRREVRVRVREEEQTRQE